MSPRTHLAVRRRQRVFAWLTWRDGLDLTEIADAPEAELWFVPPEPGQNPRHVDLMWPLWSVLYRTADGRGDTWQPALEYR